MEAGPLIEDLEAVAGTDGMRRRENSNMHDVEEQRWRRPADNLLAGLRDQDTPTVVHTLSPYDDRR